MTKGLPPLRKMKLSKKAQEKDEKIKWKLHTSNRNWNDWNFQLHCINLEWVNPRSKVKIKTIFNFFKIYIYIDKDDITAHWFGYSLLK